MNSEKDTIYALSTPDLASAICVFRLSGENCLEIAKKLSHKRTIRVDYASYVTIYHPDNQEIIDKGIMFYKKAPKSFTGEDMLEIQLHGSRAVIQSMHHILSNIKLCRQAEQGEFTKRAYLNGKIDIFQAEALSDLIHAQTEYQRKVAQQGLDGKFSLFISQLRHELLHLFSTTNALIDFADDEVPPELENSLQNTVQNLKNNITLYLKNASTVSEVKNGYRVVIIGAPNVGKSSFINNILDREVAIVSEKAGTTRDTLEFTLDLSGYPVIFYDTAGLRETECVIEQKGIELAKKKLSEAHLILHLIDPFDPSSRDKQIEFLKDINNAVTIFTKKDIYKKNIKKILKNEHVAPNFYFFISNVSRETIFPILDYIVASFKNKYDKNNIYLTQDRYVVHLKNINHALDNSLNNLLKNDFFLFSEDLRIIQYELEKLTMKIDTEEILGAIFSSFCIGK